MSCIYCKKAAALQCSKCKMVLYCCRDHQIAHFVSHKSLCTNYKKAIEKMENEEQKVRNDDPYGEGNPFEYGIGQFWSIFETRAYMRSRIAVIQVFEAIGTFQSISAAVENVLGCLRLCRGDNPGVRDWAPSLMLRIDHNRQCYDFLKWWATCDAGNYETPFMSVKNADILEPVLKEFVIEKKGGYGQSVQYFAAMVLVKFKILKIVKQIQAFDSFLLGAHDRLGAESLVKKLAGNDMVLSLIYSYLPVSSKEITRRVLDERGGVNKVANNLQAQVDALITYGTNRNARLWPAIINPTPLMRLPMASAYGLNTAAEVQLALTNVLPSWQETEGAVDMLIAKFGKKPTYDCNLALY